MPSATDKTVYLNVYNDIDQAEAFSKVKRDEGFDVHLIGPTPDVAIEQVYANPPKPTISTPVGQSYFVVIAANKS